MLDEAQTHTALFQLTGVRVVHTNMESGLFERANQAFCEMVGYSETELREMTYLQLTHPDDREHDAGEFAALQRGEREGGTSLTRCVYKDGRVIWLELHITVLHEKGETTNITVVNNVTVRRRAEEALRESEARFRNMADHAPISARLPLAADRRLLCLGD